MKRAIWISLLAILGFATILLVRLPASWLKGFLPPNIACGDIAGTAWEGSCSRVTYNGAPLGNLNWELHPAALFRGKLAAFVDLTRGDDFIRGDIEAGRGESIVAHDLQAQMPLDPSPIPGMSTGYTGNVSLNLAFLRVEKGIITAIEGQAESTSLYSKQDRMVIGAYSVSFPKVAPGAEPVGTVMSLDGPVDFEGKVTLTKEPGYRIEGRVRPKADTPPAIVDQLKILGTPDSEGWRPIGQVGTF
jgi:hypothetical protein